jgi:hypothetical protein
MMPDWQKKDATLLSRREALLVITAVCFMLCSCNEQPPTPLTENLELSIDEPFTENLQSEDIREPSEDQKAADQTTTDKYSASLLEKPSERVDGSDPEIENGLTTGSDQPGLGKPLIELQIKQDFRSVFYHGEKGPSFQKYIVLHDTEGESGPASVISWWAGNGNLVAAHFIVGKDGVVYQCVPLDKIAHHAGFGYSGFNAMYGISEDGRDDMRGTTWVGGSYTDYAMNAWSIGIEMVHVGGSGNYPEAQLEALDALIAYIDQFYGFASRIIDHKAWAVGNSDTSIEFARYLLNYQDHRNHYDS